MDEKTIFLFFGGTILLAVLFERGLSRWKMPAILAYIIAGAYIGSTVFSPFSTQLKSLEIINTLTLSLMGLHLGTELRWADIKKMGRSIISITIVQSFVTWLAVFLGAFLISRSAALSIIYAALAVATAPAGIVEVIQQFKAKGKFTSTLFAVMGLDDIVALLVFSFSLPVARLLFLKEIGDSGGDHGISYSLLHALFEIFLAVGIGGIVGLILCNISKKIHDKTIILLVGIGILFLLCGVAEQLKISPLLLTMCTGMTLVNRSSIIARKYSDVYAEWAPPIYLIFFALIGARMNILEIGTEWLMLLGYIVFRCFGKYFGAFLGAIIGKSDSKIRDYLGWTLFSQAGVTLGLTYASIKVIDEIAQVAPKELGTIYNRFATQVANVMTTASFLILLFGPILVKYGLKKAGEIRNN